MRGLVILALVTVACGDDDHPSAADAQGDADAAAPDAAGFACATGDPAPDCCSVDGHRLTSATCAGRSWACAEGQLCACAGQPMTFMCAELCGSDAFVAPQCGASGWACSGGLVRTDECPSGTCWGEGPTCCGDAGAVWSECVGGVWQCPAGTGPCP